MTKRVFHTYVGAAVVVAALGLSFWFAWPLQWYRIVALWLAVEVAHSSAETILALRRKEFAICSHCHKPCHECTAFYGTPEEKA